MLDDHGDFHLTEDGTLEWVDLLALHTSIVR